MNTHISCPNCDAPLRVKEEHFGRRVVCKKCREIFQVPDASEPVLATESSRASGSSKRKRNKPAGATPQNVKSASARRSGGNSPHAVPVPSETSPPADAPPRKKKSESQPARKKPKAANREQTVREIMNSFRGEIEPVELTLTYRFGILLATLVMLLLPLLYLGMIGLACYGIFYHAFNHTEMVTSGSSGRQHVGGLLIYLAPMVAGGIIVLFMLKPLFSRVEKRSTPLTISSDDEPAVYAFVDRICDAVGAPNPQDIVVDCEVNASAGFRKGMLSMLGSDLRLTIGLPLVAGLSIREFAGVLAHEFGHFSQGAGMRLSFLVRSISFWFTRVVYERDIWDVRLEQWSRSIDLRIAWILYLTRFFVWLTRRVLWVLMMIGHAVAGYLLRQMEFDADRYEARLAGSDTFEVTCRRLTVMGVASNGAYSDLNDFYREGRLADNLPRLISANVDQIPPQAKKELNKAIDETPTHWFDTHPANGDRIESAYEENAPGIFRREEPASVLFKNFPQLCRRATKALYRQIFGKDLKREKIHPVEDLLERQQEEQESFKALERYFQGAFHPVRPLQFSEWHVKPPEDSKKCAAALKTSRRNVLATAPKARRAYKKAEEKEGSSIFMHALDPRVEPFETSSAKRLFAALQLLYAPDLSEKIDDVTFWQHETKLILEALSVVNNQIDALVEMAIGQNKLGELLSELDGNQNDQRLISSILQQMQPVENLVCSIRGKLEAVDYPFDHAAGEISIGEVALRELPDHENPFEIYQAADALIDVLPKLFARLVGRLCVSAEKVESAVGLTPLQAPL